MQNKGTAATALAISVAVALYGTTGVLEAARRALNVVFEIESGRSFRGASWSTWRPPSCFSRSCSSPESWSSSAAASPTTCSASLVSGPTAAKVWSLARWPAALLVAMLVFSFIYFVTPDVQQRSWRWMTPGAAIGVLLWLLASWGFPTYLSKVADVGAIYGAFAGAIVLLAWIWLTNVAMLFGAELNAEIERQKELRDGVPSPTTLNRPARQG